MISLPSKYLGTQNNTKQFLRALKCYAKDDNAALYSIQTSVVHRSHSISPTKFVTYHKKCRRNKDIMQPSREEHLNCETKQAVDAQILKLKGRKLVYLQIFATSNSLIFLFCNKWPRIGIIKLNNLYKLEKHSDSADLCQGSSCSPVWHCQKNSNITKHPGYSLWSFICKCWKWPISIMNPRQRSARPTCHSHAMTRTGREPATIYALLHRSSPRYAPPDTMGLDRMFGVEVFTPHYTRT